MADGRDQLPYIDADEVTRLTPWPALIDAIRQAFREGGISPERHHHTIPGSDRDDITLLLMPAWNPAGSFGVKLASISPSNAAIGKPTLHGVYVLFAKDTGVPMAVLDAGSLTARRTAAASALASQCLSRAASSTLLIIGTGRVARQLIAAHCSVRPITEVRIWGRDAQHAEEAIEAIRDQVDADCRAVSSIEEGAAGADIVSSAIPTEKPLLRGHYLGPGTHVDLVGAYTPAMCEADPELIAMAGQVFIDTMEGALSEAGDLLQAAEMGVFDFDDIAGDMYRMASSESSLRRDTDEITVFKSVGAALEDLAAAELCRRGRA
ncbi:MAG: ornithine cyclodeaminase family protein [Woeseiaceae bacterium]|nr:ornithine cyclodeaminase family protein [Woeseiaceae bacterium]